MLQKLFLLKLPTIVLSQAITVKRNRFLQENNVNLTAENYEGITSEEKSDDDNDIPIIITILCIFVLMCVCGTIIEVNRRNKIKKEINKKLLEEKRLSLQINFTLLNQIEASIQANYWQLISSNTNNLKTIKYLKFYPLSSSHNIIELKIDAVQNEQPWQAEGHISINQESQAVLQMRTSLDCELLQKKEQSDHLYLLQRYCGIYNDKSDKFVGTWSVYGSQELNVLNFCGDFELKKDLF